MIRAVALSPEKSEKFREDLKLEAIKKLVRYLKRKRANKHAKS